MVEPSIDSGTTTIMYFSLDRVTYRGFMVGVRKTVFNTNYMA